MYQLPAETRLDLVNRQHAEMRRVVVEDRLARPAPSDTVEPAHAVGDRNPALRRRWLGRIPAMLGRRLARGF